MPTVINSLPVIHTDAVLWYNVGVFGEVGYGVPNWGNDVATLNQNIWDLVDLIGRNLFHIMHHEDVNLRTPPSINTLKRVHKLYVRSGHVLSGRSVPPGKDNMETEHAKPSPQVFRVYPCPYFKVRNPFMKRWANLVMFCLVEAMQHTENAKAIEISLDFGGTVGQFIRRAYVNMCIELFGKKQAEADAPGFVLTPEDFNAYDPSKFFTRTEMIDTVSPINRVFTEDVLAPLAEGIPVTQLPSLRQWPVDAVDYYKKLKPATDEAVLKEISSIDRTDYTTGPTGTVLDNAPIVPPPPAP